MCVCVCICICANASASVFFLAASVRLASRLIAEGIAKLARPNHSRQSAMSSMSVTHGHHLAVSPSSSLSLFLSFSHAWMNIFPCHPSLRPLTDQAFVQTCSKGGFMLLLRNPASNTQSASLCLFYFIYCIFYFSLIPCTETYLAWYLQ